MLNRKYSTENDCAAMDTLALCSHCLSSVVQHANCSEVIPHAGSPRLNQGLLILFLYLIFFFNLWAGSGMSFRALY